MCSSHHGGEEDCVTFSESCRLLDTTFLFFFPTAIIPFSRGIWRETSDF